jgi:hypothetical protein
MVLRLQKLGSGWGLSSSMYMFVAFLAASGLDLLPHMHRTVSLASGTGHLQPRMGMECLNRAPKRVCATITEHDVYCSALTGQQVSCYQIHQASRPQLQTW